MIHGFLNINKASGMTSHTVVARLRRILGIKKIGHTGTLDPDVTGVLPIAIGQATKLSQYLLDADKVYEGQLILGIATDTEDYSGEIRHLINHPDQLEKLSKLRVEEIQAAMQTFLGQIEQTPPMYSAVKVQGKRLYQLARQGQEIERKSRQVTIHDFTCLALDKFTHEGQVYPLIKFKVASSKGTYVRTLCVQLGEVLGYPATMYSLVRTQTASFDLKSTITLEIVDKAQAAGEIRQHLLNMDTAVDQLPAIYLDERESQRVLNGMKISHKFNNEDETNKGASDPLESSNKKLKTNIGQEFRIYNPTLELIAIYELVDIVGSDYRLKAKKVFREAIISE